MFGLNPLTSIIQSIIAVFVYKYALKFFKFCLYVGLFTMFLYSEGPSDKEMKEKPYWVEVGYRATHLLRHNVRLLTAKVFPLKPSYFYNVSIEEAKDFPDFNNALIPDKILTTSQREYFSRGKHEYRYMSREFKNIYNAMMSDKTIRSVASERK